MDEASEPWDESPRTKDREDVQMSRDAVTTVVRRAIADTAFRRQIATDPSGALGAFDLSAEEIAALRGNDPAKLGSFGVDRRMSKLFLLDPGDASTVLVTTAAEPRDVEPWFAGASTDALTATPVEPHDVEPTDLTGGIGGNSHLEY